MARPKRIAGEIGTAAKILNAARLEFAAKGLSARLEDIGARCGLSRASILHHFASKQILLDTIFKQAADIARTRMLEVALANQNDYQATIRGITLAMRLIEEEERGTAAIVLHALLAHPVSATLKTSFQELLALDTHLVLQAGGGQYHTPDCCCLFAA